MTAARWTGEAGARQALPQLAALETVLTDPLRLVRLLQDADDREDAVRMLGTSFGLPPEHSSIVLDNTFGVLVGSRRAALAEELRILRAPWGPPLELTLRARGGGSAVLGLDGTEHTFRNRSRDGLLDAVTRFVQEEVAVPRLRPVLLSTDLPGGPVLARIWPSRIASSSTPTTRTEPIAHGGRG